MLDEKLLTTQLVEPGLIRRLVRFGTVSSTNAELIAASHAANFAAEWPHLSVLTAEEQTSGRGRLGRAWSSPKATALSTSILLRPSLDRTQWHWLTLTAGLALVRTLDSRGVPAALKWPNDVHIDGRKIAGLLAAVPSGDPSALILGCGINVLQTHAQLPTPTSTSLLVELARADRDAPAPHTQAAAQLRTHLLADWLATFVKLVRQAESTRDADVYGAADGHADFAGLRSNIIATISTTGQDVRVELPGGTAVRGRALGVNGDGALEVQVTARRRTVLDPEAGGGHARFWEATVPVTETYTAGDVVHLRSTRS